VYDHVLVGTDGSMSSVRAVGTAARLARAHDARLTIANSFAVRSGGAAARSLVDAAAQHAQAVASGDLAIDTRTEPGTTVSVLRALIAELRPDAVVVGNANVRRALGRSGRGDRRLRRTDRSIVIVDTSDAGRAAAAR
jgi:nucleotide-binding universal stress UspA family protein